MAISIKSLITELKFRYTVPKVEIFKQTEEGQNPDNYIKARTLFYDFYAMDNIHNHLGENPYLDRANPIKKSVAAQNRGVTWYDPSEEDLVVFPGSGQVLNEKQRDLIENAYGQVTKAIANKLMVHLRLGLIQELRHLLDHSSWDNFYRTVGDQYSYNKNLTARQFQKIVKDTIPGMANELESVIRLLKFTKAYKGHSSKNDPADIAAKAMQTGDEYDDPGPLSGHEEGVPIKMPGEDEPDTTDYGADAIEDSPYWEEEPSPEKPSMKDPSGYIQHGDYWNPDPGAAVYHSDEEPEEFDDYGNPKKKKQNYAFTHKKDKSKLTEATPAKFSGARMSPELLKSIRQAINKSGLRWEDVDNAYNKIEWSSSWGGKMWGTGTKSFLKLVARASEMDAQEMANVVDHIFDLMHNTGGLLNKGGMFIADEDLDRRAKCTHVARFLPYVSPDIKQLILMFLKHYPGNAEEQKNIDVVLNSPHSKGFSPEQVKVLTDFGFYKHGWAYRADIRFFSKKLNKHEQPIEIFGRYYEIKAHEDGRFTLADGLKADVQIFDSFDNVPTYIAKTFSNDIKKKNAPYSPPPPAPPSEKQIYISSHTRIRLPADKEAQLLTVNMGWRPKSNYYKAYFPGSKRFYLYAFDDGSLLTTYDNTEVFKTFLDWNAAFIHITGETKDAEDYTKHSALAPATPSVANSPVITPPTTHSQQPTDSKLGGLTQSEYNQLTSTVGISGLSVGVAQAGGSVPIYIPSTQTKVFSAGKVNNYYNVWQTSNNGVTVGNWNFHGFPVMLGFISKNITALINGQNIPKNASVTPSPSVASLSTTNVQLPPNAGSSAAYSMHSGLDVPPKTTIRLTTLDEGTLASLGFTPKMIGKDVYYIHSMSGDAVKFYPNNIASLSFSKAGGSSVKFDIKKMMQWLGQKYTPTSVSPIKAPLSHAPLSHAPSYTMGIQAGPMFEAKIFGAGFSWDATKGLYMDAKYNGKNNIYIRPNRSSVVSIVDTLTNTPEQHYFANLPALTAYLSGQYPTDAQKKTEPVTSNEPPVPVHEPPPFVGSDHTLVFPSWVPSEIRRVMKHGNFAYSGPIDEQSYRYYIQNNEDSNVLYINPDQTFTVFDEAFLGYDNPKKFTSVSDVMVNYFNKKYENAKQVNPLIGGAELQKLLTDNGFKFTLINAEDGNTYEHPDGSTLAYYPKLGTSNYWDANTKHLEQFYTVAAALTFLKHEFSKELPTTSNVIYSPGDPIKVKPSWVPPKVFQLMEKGKYAYTGPVHGHPKTFRYRNESGDIIWMHPGNTYEVFDKNDSFESEKYDADGFLEYLYEKFGSLPGGTNTNEDIAAQMTSTMKNAGLLEPNGTIVSPNKVDAIKYLKSFVEKTTGKVVKLVNLKHSVENFPWFAAYVKEHGFPPMGMGDNTLYHLNDYSMTINKPRLEPTGYMYKSTSDEGNSMMIRLNLHDEKLLKNCDFLWTPKDNAYYKDIAGRIAKFYSTGKGMLVDTNNNVIEFDTIPELLNYIVQMYGPESSLKKGSSKSSTMQKDLTTERLEKLGFVESSYQFNSFTKKVEDPPNGTFLHKVTLNPADESMKYEILMGSDKGGYSLMKEEKFDSIPAGLTQLEQWMGSEEEPVKPKSAPMPFGGTNYVKDPKSNKSMKLDLNEELILSKLGFTYKTGANAVKDLEQWYSNAAGEDVLFRENGTGGYWTADKKYTPFPTVKTLMQWLWDKSNKATPKASNEVPFSGIDYAKVFKEGGIDPSYSVTLDEKDEKTLEKIGFKKHIVFGPNGPYQSAYRKGTERMFFFANGTADYWKDEHGKTASFESYKEAMQFLWDINGPTGTPKATGDMPFSGFDYANLWKTQGIPKQSSTRLVDEDESTLKQLGFRYTSDGNMKAYRKGLEQMMFHADGTAAYFDDYNKQYPTMPFPSVKAAMEFVWKKHSIFIEEKISYKSMMRAMLE